MPESLCFLLGKSIPSNQSSEETEAGAVRPLVVVAGKHTSNHTRAWSWPGCTYTQVFSEVQLPTSHSAKEACFLLPSQLECP